MFAKTDIKNGQLRWCPLIELKISGSHTSVFDMGWVGSYPELGRFNYGLAQGTAMDSYETHRRK
jgi:hypothetical protein